MFNISSPSASPVRTAGNGPAMFRIGTPSVSPSRNIRQHLDMLDFEESSRHPTAGLVKTQKATGRKVVSLSPKRDAPSLSPKRNAPVRNAPPPTVPSARVQSASRSPHRSPHMRRTELSDPLGDQFASGAEQLGGGDCSLSHERHHEILEEQRANVVPRGEGAAMRSARLVQAASVSPRTDLASQITQITQRTASHASHRTASHRTASPGMSDRSDRSERTASKESAITLQRE